SGAYRASVAAGLLRKFFIEVAMTASVANAEFADEDLTAAFPNARAISGGTAGTVVVPYRGFTAIPWWIGHEQSLGDATAAAVMAPDGVNAVPTPARSPAVPAATPAISTNGTAAHVDATAAPVPAPTPPKPA